MTKHFRYVQFDRVLDFMRVGWMVEGDLPGHHNIYSCLMVWPCSCQPCEPQ